MRVVSYRKRMRALLLELAHQERERLPYTPRQICQAIGCTKMCDVCYRQLMQNGVIRVRLTTQKRPNRVRPFILPNALKFDASLPRRFATATAAEGVVPSPDTPQSPKIDPRAISAGSLKTFLGEILIPFRARWECFPHLPGDLPPMGMRRALQRVGRQVGGAVLRQAVQDFFVKVAQTNERVTFRRFHDFCVGLAKRRKEK